MEDLEKSIFKLWALRRAREEEKTKTLPATICVFFFSASQSIEESIYPPGLALFIEPLLGDTLGWKKELKKHKQKIYLQRLKKIFPLQFL